MRNSFEVRDTERQLLFRTSYLAISYLGSFRESMTDRQYEAEGQGGEDGQISEEERINREHFEAYQLISQKIMDRLNQPDPADISPVDIHRLASSIRTVQNGQRLAKQMDDRKGEAQELPWLGNLRDYALKDLGLHRSLMRENPLYPPQAEAIRLVEEHIRGRTGKVITIRSARQTMKNECSGMLCLRALLRYKDEGGVYIRTAPTWKPQITNSKLRVEKFLRKDPFVNKNYRKREGFIIQYGQAQLVFLSSGREANVVGGTASICLDIDEAHKVDKGKFSEDFVPMTAYNNVPVIMWGVAADKQDLLYEQVQYNREHYPELNLTYPASVWSELMPQYARHYEEQRKRLGADHPIILTQYDLVDVESVGGYLKPHQIMQLLDGQHERFNSPRSQAAYVVTIDIAGEAEEEEDDPLKKSAGRRDSTVALVFEVDFEERVNDYPPSRLVDMHWWVGKSLGNEPSGLPGQQETLLKLLELWKPKAAIVDARGVGEQIAKYLAKRYPNITAYTASAQSVSEDCYGLLAMLNNDRVKVFRNDSSQEYQELCRQLRHCKYEIGGHEYVRLLKPAPDRHIDMVKALTYLHRAVTVRQSAPAAVAWGDADRGTYSSGRNKRRIMG